MWPTEGLSDVCIRYWTLRLDVCRLKTRLFFLTLFAMIAFASNSLLCRAALKETSIDAASFTFIRIFAGAVALWLILQTRRKLIVDRTASPLVERSEAGTSFPSPQSSPTRRGSPFSL